MVWPHTRKPTRAHTHTHAHSPPRLGESPPWWLLRLKARVLAKLLEEEQQLEAAQALQALGGQRLPPILLPNPLPVVVVVVRGLRGVSGDVALVRLHRPLLLLLGRREHALEALVLLQGWQPPHGEEVDAAPRGTLATQQWASLFSLHQGQPASSAPHLLWDGLHYLSPRTPPGPPWSGALGLPAAPVFVKSKLILLKIIHPFLFNFLNYESMILTFTGDLENTEQS